MSDDLDELKADWRRQQVVVEKVRHDLRRARAWMWFMLVIEGAATLLCFVLAPYSAVIAWKRHDLDFALGALVLLLVPPLAVQGLRLRVRGLKWEDRTPEGTLRYAVQRLALTIRILRLAYWDGVVILAFVPMMWAAALLGWTPRRHPVLESALYILSGVATFIWLAWRLRRVRAQHASSERLLATFVQAARNDSRDT